MNPRVVVTGAAGYIGGETVLKLLDTGYDVLGIDREVPPAHLTNYSITWVRDNFASSNSLNWISVFNPSAIIHCAGTSLVGPSIHNPAEYYQNNFIRTKKLLDHIVQTKLNTRIVFSSSAAVYGEPVHTPCLETDPTMPISPYGESKLMIEYMLASYARAYGLDYVAFRYFNACGADSQGRHGQNNAATHIIARVLESIRDNKLFTLYGNQYPTPDGTCIRDYIHVEDLADAHILALSPDVPSGVYNLGNGIGNSNLDIIAAAERAVGTKVNIVIDKQRDGDPAILTADPYQFWQYVNWKPKYTLDDIVQHAWKWYV